MPPRRKAPSPIVTAAEVQEAAKAASRKAERAPHRLSDAEVQLLPGKKVLELGNAGRLRHLGVGLPLKAPARAAAGPKAGKGKPAAKRSTGKGGK